MHNDGCFKVCEEKWKVASLNVQIVSVEIYRWKIIIFVLED